MIWEVLVRASTWSAKRFAVLLVLYVVGFLAASIVGLGTSGHGFDTSAREVLSFHLAFDFLFGLAVGGLWPLAFPALFYLVLEPLLSVVFSGGNGGRPTFPLDEFVLLGTLSIALGLACNALLRITWRRLQ